MSVVSLHNVSFLYRNSTVLEGLSLAIDRNEIVAIFGPNGVGKSTLLKIAMGALSPTSGEMRSCFQSDERVEVPQDYRASLLPWYSTIDNILLPLRLSGVSQGDVFDRAREILGVLDIGEWVRRYPSELSGGQAQLACIARALLTGRKFLLMDEPLSSVDYVKTLQVRGRLAVHLRKQACTAMFVSHNIETAVALADKVVFLGDSPARIQAIVPIIRGSDCTERFFFTKLFQEQRDAMLEIVRRLYCDVGSGESSTWWL
jgi:NitT/TauT family transport system ATP-binding protein